MNTNHNLILIGMSGAGKSTIGVLLAKALGMNYIDTDIVIQQQEGKLLQEILDQDGSERFIEIEERIVSALQAVNTVIATGGSVIYSDKAIHALKRNGRVIYLDVPFEEILGRLTNMTTRGIVFKNGNSLRDVYMERAPLYEKHADIILDCSKKDAEQCVAELTAILK